MTQKLHYHFVTGRLAAPSLNRVVPPLAAQIGFDYSIDVLPITVAALMTPEWIAPRVTVPNSATHLMLPGYCRGDLGPLQNVADRQVVVGPKDLHELPEFFGQDARQRADYGGYSIQILAEINYAPRLPLEQIITMARNLADEGADIIDLGCDPGHCWKGVGDCVQALRDNGLRVSIDSFDPYEVEAAIARGAELVLSVNSHNCRAACAWPCRVVVIPDDPETLSGLDNTVQRLAEAKVPFVIDPILRPIGTGFAASLASYLEVRRRYPDADMLMGIGNLTELTDADSAATNVLLLGFCEELSIRYVLTTQVINWARSSVKECDLARRLVHYAVRFKTIPKHVEPQLVLLRDPQLYPQGKEALDRLAHEIRDPNYRIFAEDNRLHVISAGMHLEDQDPYQLFQKLLATHPRNVDVTHAFYLGYELAKAVTALTLAKQYRQDESLRWGYLTRPEESGRSHRIAREITS